MAAHTFHKTKVVAVILAAGKGKRAGFKKQFVQINGKPLFFYSLKKCLDNPLINSVVMVLPKRMDFLLVKKYTNKYTNQLSLITGGQTRTISIARALAHIKTFSTMPDYVIIHDAARPLLTHIMIEDILKAATKNVAAVMGVRAIDTIAEGSGSYITAALDKGVLYYTFTPHCYKFDLLWDAHQAGNNHRDYKNCENIHLMLNAGHKIKIVDCYYPNLKFTYAADLNIIKRFLTNERKKTPI